MAVPPFPELLATASRSAIHLEMRDVYTPSDPLFTAWQRGEPVDRSEREQMWRDLIGGAVARGVQLRRARVVSEPLSPYIRYEQSVTEATNVAAGEQVRWLPRSRTLDLCLPGLDFWLLDDHTMRAHHFAGDGEGGRPRARHRPGSAQALPGAFEAIWQRGIPHAEYEVA